jgi:hypothetical protein
MVPRYDNRQWKQACREVGLEDDERRLATKDLHKEKGATGDRSHMPYGDLITWLRDWKEDRWL